MANRTKIVLLACCLPLAALLIARGARSDSSSGQRLTSTQAIYLRHISDLTFAPDGTRLAFTVTEPPKDANSLSHIWALDVAARTARQYTFSDKSENMPRWSPDGKFLGFLSNRSNFKQIYVLPSDGGEAYAITTGKRNIASFEWSPDGKQIAFVAPNEPTAEEEAKEPQKDDARVIDRDAKHNRAWILDPATRKAQAITEPQWEVRELAWIPQDHRLLIIATDHPESDIIETNRIFSLDPATMTMNLVAAPKGPFRNLRVSLDGKWVAYVGSRGDGPDPHDIYVQPLDPNKSGPARNLTASSIDRPVRGIEWRSDGSLVAIVETGFKTTLYSLAIGGSAKTIDSVTPNPRAFALSSSGALAFVGDTATEPQEIYLSKGENSPSRFTTLNAGWDQIVLSKPESFHYPSFDGLEIEGSLLRPLDHEGTSSMPLIVLVHGGPTGAWSDSIEPWGQLLAAHGFAVAYFNIRGSVGYGEKFVEMNRTDWGGGDFKDVMAGVDYLVARGIADPDRLGIGGWSYGGYMSEWAITQTNRFKCAVSGAGMVDLISEFETENHPAGDRWFYGVPFENSADFLKGSPFMYLKQAHTPILILQGEADTTDPLGQSTALYRGLKFYGAPAELVQYPREDHAFTEEKHLIDRLNRIVAWYEKYLK